LVLCGTQDRLTPVKYAAFLQDQIAGAVLHLVEGAGHMVMIEKPQPVVRALVDFLAKL
jgi:pimeloyl-ACP methyl ester carboxylesterase